MSYIKPHITENEQNVIVIYIHILIPKQVTTDLLSVIILYKC